jgi:hypothetical protein
MQKYIKSISENLPSSLVLLRAGDDRKCPVENGFPMKGWTSRTESDAYDPNWSNYAMLTGAVSGIWVFDVDNKEYKDGRKNMEVINDWFIENDFIIEDAFVVETPSGGYHIYFKYTDDLEHVVDNYQEFNDIQVNGKCVIFIGSSYNKEYIERYDKITKKTTKVNYPYSNPYKILYDNEITEAPKFILDVVKRSVKKEPIELHNIEECNITPENQSICSDYDYQQDLRYDSFKYCTLEEKKYYIKKLTEIINPNRITNYNNWVNTAFLLKNELGEDGYDIFHTLSKRDKKGYISLDENEDTREVRVRNKWKSDIKCDPCIDNKITVASLLQWSKEDNLEKYDKLLKPLRKKISQIEKEENEIQAKSNFLVKVEEFEKTHCKIMSKGIYIRCYKDNIYFLKQKQLEEIYKHISYGKERERFIDHWMEYDDIRIYEDIDCYPDRSKCPEDCYNTWTDYYVDTIKEYTENIYARDLILKHIMILCNHDDNCYNYILKWIAHLLKYPDQKAHMITFLSGQGGGKGCLMKLLERIIGTQKYFQTTKPERDVWGNFNGIMLYKMLVNINELSKKKALDADDDIKGLITDETIVINQKNINQIVLKSFHRFIITTNNLETIKLPEDDRRNVVIKCSNELMGNKEYFIEMFNLLNDDNVIKTIGEYFKQIEVNKDFLNEPIPNTDLRQDLIDLSMGPYKMWLNSFSSKRSGIIDMYCGDLYRDFNNFMDENRLDYKNINLIKFAKNIVYINNVQRGKKDKKGAHIIIDTDAIKKNLGIEIEEEQEGGENIYKELKNL